MGVFTETGYSLPGGDQPLTHARFLHAGNRVIAQSVAASVAQADGPASAADNALTFEKWKPFVSQFPSPDDLSVEWTKTGVTIGSDLQTMDEGTGSGSHSVSDAITLTAVEWVHAVRVDRQTCPQIKLRASGTNNAEALFHLGTETVSGETGGTGRMVKIGPDEFICLLYWTATASSYSLFIEMANGAGATSYVGTDNTIRILRAIAHESAADWTLTAHADQAADLFAVAGHNVYTGGNGRLAFQYNNGTWQTLDTITPTDDSPVMYIFGEQTETLWRVVVDRVAEPEIAVIRVGKPLQMPHAIHQGHRPFKSNRVTQMRGNLSEGGEWLGRSTIRRFLDGSFKFPHLKPAFVDASLNGLDGFIRAMEREPFFVAWRPDTYDEAHYAWTAGPVNGPTYDQRPNLSTFAFKCQAYGYE